MNAIHDLARASCVAAAAASLAAYASGAGPAGIAAFCACAAAFALSLVPDARKDGPPWIAGLPARAAHSMRRILGAAVRLASESAGRGQRRAAPVRVRKARPDSQLVLVLRSGVRGFLDTIVDADALKRVYGELNPDMFRSVVHSGIATNLKELRREAGTALVASSLAAAGAAALVAAAGMAEAGIAAVLLPAAALFYPRIKLKVVASERKRALVDEMTFFAVYCLLLAEVGKTMVYALSSTVGRGVFPALEREAAIMERGRGLGMGRIVALGDLGRNHPNADFGNMLGGYVAAFNAGDPKAHLKSQAEELLGKMQKRMEAYKEQSSSLCVMVVFTMFFLPVMVSPVAVIAGAKSAAFLSQVSFLAIPLMAALVCVIAHGVQPKFGDTVRCDWRIPLGLSACAGAAAGILEPDRAWAAMAAASIVFAACSTVLTQRQRRIASSIDRSQGPFFRDITSYVNSGDSSILHALNSAAGSGGRRYDRDFAAILARAAFRIRHTGQTVQDVLADTARGSWLGRFSFFLLSRIADTGSVNAWVLTRTTEFVEKFVAVKRDVASSIRPYLLVSAASPVGVVVMAWFLKSSLIGATGDLSSVYGFENIGVSGEGALSKFDEAVNSMTMASAICANVAIGKIASMSVTDTRPLLAGTLVALAGILASPYLP